MDGWRLVSGLVANHWVKSRVAVSTHYQKYFDFRLVEIESPTCDFNYWQLILEIESGLSRLRTATLVDCYAKNWTPEKPPKRTPEIVEKLPILDHINTFFIRSKDSNYPARRRDLKLKRPNFKLNFVSTSVLPQGTAGGDVLWSTAAWSFAKRVPQTMALAQSLPLTLESRRP